MVTTEQQVPQRENVTRQIFEEEILTGGIADNDRATVAKSRIT